MSFFVDFFPLLSFFISYKFLGIYTATYILIATSALQLAYYRIRDGKFTSSKVWLFLAILAFGGMTVYFHNDLFLKWKVTIIYSAFALYLSINYFFSKKPFIEMFFQLIDKGMKPLPKSLISKLTFLWILTNVSLAIINIYIAYNYSQATWVNFKVWGSMGAQFSIMMLSLYFVFPFMTPEEESGTNISNQPETEKVD